MPGPHLQIKGVTHPSRGVYQEWVGILPSSAAFLCCCVQALYLLFAALFFHSGWHQDHKSVAGCDPAQWSPGQVSGIEEAHVPSIKQAPNPSWLSRTLHSLETKHCWATVARWWHCHGGSAAAPGEGARVAAGQTLTCAGHKNLQGVSCQRGG